MKDDDLNRRWYRVYFQDKIDNNKFYVYDYVKDDGGVISSATNLYGVFASLQEDEDVIKDHQYYKFNTNWLRREYDSTNEEKYNITLAGVEVDYECDNRDDLSVCYFKIPNYENVDKETYDVVISRAQFRDIDFLEDKEIKAGGAK